MDSDRFGVEMPTHVVPPDKTTTRLFGILNIIFSLLAACIAAYALAMAIVMPMMAESMEEASKAMEESSAEELKILEEKEAAATTEEEKAEIKAEREALEAMSKVDLGSPFGAMNNPKVQFYGLVNGSSGLFLNLLMFISGVGLLYRKEWARQLALWVAGFKIVRLLALQAYNMMVVIPVQAKAMQEMFEQMNLGNGGAAAPNGMAEMQGVMYTAWAVVSLVVGCIYPVLCLWFLSRPGVKANCQSSDEAVLFE